MGRLCLRSSSTVSQDNDSGCHSPVILPQHVLTLPGIAKRFSALLPGQIARCICQECFTEQRKDKNCILPCRENKIRSESTFFRNAPCAKPALLLANTGDDEQQSLQEVSPIGAPDLQDDAELWVQVAGADLAITEDERKWWVQALRGLHDLHLASLDRGSR